MLHELAFCGASFATVVVCALVFGKLTDVVFKRLARFFLLYIVLKWSGK